MPDHGGPWVWDDETEKVVSRLVIAHPSRARSHKGASTTWFVKQAMATIGDKAEAGAVAAAVAWHQEDARKR